ncbi:MAG: tRNA (N(6)-L-threonylcarbamoyladenosine(37)-C(2))-methylthiotransferase MtaB [Desulfovibrio sp.]|nr:MAG: tRNA (N(6)-L-threonylcarbamoyladenosine(37)-C(2))-methylthiotransferase MtaB [Desulfovibrio sp.]
MNTLAADSLPCLPQAVFHVATLGCKINQYETQSLREAWLGLGWLETDDPAQAAVVVVNSCAVTQRAVSDLRQAVRKLRRQAPEARLVVTGCAAQVLAKELRDMAEVDCVVGQDRKDQLHELLPYLAGESSLESREGSGETSGEASEEAPESGPIQATTFPPFSIRDYQRARAVLKIQDGCTRGCTYCIVPSTRGASVSREPRHIEAELARLLDAGVREITLSGINLRQFGRDFSPENNIQDLWDLAAHLNATFAPNWLGRARLRISSLDPAQLTAKTLDVLAQSALLCPHLHVSLQSGSPAVLGRMNRSSTDPDGLLAFMHKLRSIWPLFGLGVDVICGFPGESDKDFSLTRDLMDALPLTYAHIFPFSPRPGTRAADMDGQVGKETKAERAKELRELAQAKKQGFLEQLTQVDRLTVALEQQAPARGMCEYYVPCSFSNAQPEAAPRELTRARPLAVDEDTTGLHVAPLPGQGDEK